jgi:hypothetical protein
LSDHTGLRQSQLWTLAWLVCCNLFYTHIFLVFVLRSIPNHIPLMPRSHQTLHLVATVKLLGIMCQFRCWPTTLYTITTGDANGWCLMPRSHQTLRPEPTVILLGIMFRNKCWTTTFDTITTGDADGWCRKHLVWSAPQLAGVINPSNIGLQIIATSDY